MTYNEFCAMREKLAQVEKEYLQTWQAITNKRKRSKKLAKIANELNSLQDEIMLSKWYK